MEKIFMTPDGFKKAEEELRQLVKIEMPGVIKEVASARELGDLSENAEYHSAKEKQGMINGRIKHLEAVVGLAEVIDPLKMSGDTVKFGATVKIVDEDTDEEKNYKIVGDFEGDLSKGLISIQSPIAKSMIGKSVGDVAEVKTPSGVKAYEIEKIEYK